MKIKNLVADFMSFIILFSWMTPDCLVKSRGMTKRLLENGSGTGPVDLKLYHQGGQLYYILLLFS